MDVGKEGLRWETIRAWHLRRWWKSWEMMWQECIWRSDSIHIGVWPQYWSTGHGLRLKSSSCELERHSGEETEMRNFLEVVGLIRKTYNKNYAPMLCRAVISGHHIHFPHQRSITFITHIKLLIITLITNSKHMMSRPHH